jgi:hypothetical protein
VEAGVETVMWARHGCDWAARLATVAASLCPALSSLGGAFVGALITLMTYAVPLMQHGRSTAPRLRRRPASAGEGP